MVRRVLLVVALAAPVACAAIAGLEDPEESAQADASTPPPPEDGSPTTDTNPSAPTATFQLLCNGKVLERHTCPKKRWEHDRCPTIEGTGRSLVLRNTGSYPIGYIARRSWSGGGYIPSIATDGMAGEQAGILAPGATKELAGSYSGGTFAIFGSVRPFAEAARTQPLDDEGVVPWKQGEFAGIATNQLDVAQMTVTETSDCWNILSPTDRRHFD